MMMNNLLFYLHDRTGNYFRMGALVDGWKVNELENEINWNRA